MLKSLTRVGNSHAIVLDKVILDLLGIGANSRVNLAVNGDSLGCRLSVLHECVHHTIEVFIF